MQWRVLTIACIVIASLPVASVGEEAVGRGDFEFFLDSAAFRAADGTTRQEIYLRLPSTSLRFRETGGAYQAQAKVALRVRDAEGNEVVKDVRDFALKANTESETLDPLRFYTLTKQYAIERGAYTVTCVVEDRNAPKMTVLGMVKGQYHESIVSGYPLEVPTFPANEMSFSDARFLWEAGSVVDEATHIPNPSHMYGLYRDSLQVYMEAYLPRAQAGSNDVQIHSRIIDEHGNPMAKSSAAIPPADPAGAGKIATFPILLRENLDRFPAGTYVVYVDVSIGDQDPVRVKAGSFSVTWDMRTWEITRRSLVQEARFLLDENDFKGFSQKSVGDQEAIVQAMWREIDPDPTTGVNEAYEEFMERLAYVNARYSDYGMGNFTDRGLIYLKFGPPDEKVVDVIPLNRESMSDAMQRIEDRYHPVNFSNTGGRLGYSQPQRNIVVDPRRLGAVGEGGDVAYPYELWVYNQSGQPIRQKDRNLEPEHGLRFIFVDKEGYGRYKLESSSSMANK